MHSLYFLKSVSLVIIGNTLRIIIFIVGSRANNAISTYTRAHYYVLSRRIIGRTT